MIFTGIVERAFLIKVNLTIDLGSNKYNLIFPIF